ncbi:PIG-L deacetylase family protein [Pseudonocardia sp. MH-G8]|uniref:PIG-L deacetylase family protein n=1 Tax=Pseudonocardia sp. MH-G8 TaxID=1854588 RepID=UPI000B9FEC93|nr:PIG-L family deacetylase [Pseudonocardia sp. MH-G8]OZM78939.1 hypothetical protein CFP66_28725 [Pseudonocardia sp. MH-G8]
MTTSIATITDIEARTGTRAADTADGYIAPSLAEVPRLGTVLGIWAHPDDEVYLSGALLAAAAAAGQRVVVVTATRGERGTDDPETWPPARLARVRSQEIVQSLAVLDRGRGRIEHRFLGDTQGVCHLDGGLAADPAAGTIDELAAIVDEIAPDTVLTFGPDGMTGHPDHRAVSAWTDRALAGAGRQPRLLHATVSEGWVRDFGSLVTAMDEGEDVFSPSPAGSLAVDLVLSGDALRVKLAALRAQASQTTATELAVGTELYRAAVAGEWFRPAAVRSPRARRLARCRVG